ncbi:MAG: hypothetical protein KA911_02595, partial [Xanthomonadales bacterium]|nr:hypothetical protein [Xanthomonadales bacterium]
REFAAEELKRSIGNTARQLDLSADLRKATEGLDPLAAVKSATANAAAPAADAAPATDAPAMAAAPAPAGERAPHD